MTILTVGLLFLQVVAAAPALVARDIQCPAANGTIVTVGGKSWGIECDIDTKLGDMPSPNGQRTASLDACIQSCVDRAGCQSVAWYNKSCYLKGSIPSRLAKVGVWGAVLTSGGSPTEPDTTIKTTSTTTATATVTAPAGGDVPVKAPTVSTSAVPVPIPAASTSKSNPSTPSTVPNDGSCARPAAKSLSSKRGLPYNDASLTGAFGNKVSWAYNWGSKPGSGLASNLMYVPMLWTPTDSYRTSSWNSDALSAIAAGADTLLGFNEPDLVGQANIDVATAVKGWKDFMEPLKCKARLAAPAVTNGGAPLGLTYLKSFLAACSGCTIDVIPIHWYDSATNIQYFKNYVQDAYAAGGNRPLWITEFGASGTDAQVATFMQTVLPWLDSQPYVERYAYFWAAAGSGWLLSSGKTLSTIGQAYVSV